MKYAILIYMSQKEFDVDPQSAESASIFAAYAAYSEALQAAGAIAGGAALEGPRTATTVRVSGGKRLVQDGPFADAKEQLGGFYIIDVPSLDAALEWGARCPAASGDGGVEVRPFADFSAA
jgi:hypothetical protein